MAKFDQNKENKWKIKQKQQKPRKLLFCVSLSYRTVLQHFKKETQKTYRRNTCLLFCSYFFEVFVVVSRGPKQRKSTREGFLGRLREFAGYVWKSFPRERSYKKTKVNLR